MRKAKPHDAVQKPEPDVTKSKIPIIRSKFSLELKNCFSALQDTDDSTDTEGTRKVITEEYTDVSKKALGYKNKQRKDRISDQTWTVLKKGRH